MAYHRQTPAWPLDCVIDHLWVFEDEVVARDSGILCADGGVDLMFNLGPAQRLHRSGEVTRWSGAWVSGPRMVPFGLELESRCIRMVGVRFRPAGAAAILGVPVAEVKDQVVELRCFWRGAAAEALDRLAAAPGPEARLRALEAMLALRLEWGCMPSRAFAAAVESLRHRPTAGITHLRGELGISHKHLTRLFHRFVGLGPKIYQRVCRFRDLLARLARIDAGPDWARLAIDAGYYDQAHLCDDVRAFTGCTPARLPVPPGPRPDYLPLAAAGAAAGMLPRAPGC